MKSTQTTSILHDIFGNLRVAWQLLRDPRVPFWAKAIPFLALLYVIWPFDILTDLVPGIGQLDDLVVVLLGLKLFISAAGPNLAQQFQQDSAQDDSVTAEDRGEIVDTTFRVLEDEE